MWGNIVSGVSLQYAGECDTKKERRWMARQIRVLNHKNQKCGLCTYLICNTSLSRGESKNFLKKKSEERAFCFCWGCRERQGYER